jgi:hypothetical protein
MSRNILVNIDFQRSCQSCARTWDPANPPSIDFVNRKNVACRGGDEYLIGVVEIRQGKVML